MNPQVAASAHEALHERGDLEALLLLGARGRGAEVQDRPVLQFLAPQQLVGQWIPLRIPSPVLKSVALPLQVPQPQAGPLQDARPHLRHLSDERDPQPSSELSPAGNMFDEMSQTA